LPEPRIRYCTTDDGIDIAYCVAGNGPPLVMLPWFGTAHLEIQWRVPLWARFRHQLAEQCTVVEYDSRGCGLSARDVDDYSLDAYARDLEAVVQKTGLERFAIFGFRQSVPLAIAYAVRHTERVSGLLLWTPWDHGETVYENSHTAALLQLMESDWDLYVQSATRVMLSWGGEESSRQSVDFLRAATNPESLRAQVQSWRAFDVRELLPRVACPVVLIARQELVSPSLDNARRMAASMRDARVVVLEGSTWMPYNDAADVADLAINFIRECGGASDYDGVPAGSPSAGLRTVLFTDVVGHTEMMQRLGDARGRDVLREHERITRDLLKQHGGAEVKTMGDGFMASFASVTKAMDCAIALQRAFAAHEGEPLRVRVGLNAGEPIEEDGDLFGSTVIMASRIAAKAGAGEILIPEPLRHLLSGKSYVYADRGETILKGFEDAVRLYEVRWQA
jgi:class 3 adenylate cyclase